MFSKEAIELIKKSPNNWCFCFELEFMNNETIYLNDSGKEIKYMDKLYKTDPCLEFNNTDFDSSGRGVLELRMFANEDLSALKEKLLGAIVCVYLYFKDTARMERWLKYECMKVIQKDQELIVQFSSIASRFEASVVKFYSTSCRANFGDSSCGINLDLFPGEACDKSFRMCCNKYNNAVNFRGEPFIPTIGYFNKNDK